MKVLLVAKDGLWAVGAAATLKERVAQAGARSEAAPTRRDKRPSMMVILVRPVG